MADFNTRKTERSTTTWLTPPWMLEMLGPFDLDPCAAVGRPWDCASLNYTVEDNGLQLPWSDRVWCNPPYGREAAAFMERMAAHNGPGLALVFMLRGRVRFCYLDGLPGQAPNAASCLVAWDRSERKLLRELERSGKGKLAIL